MRPSNTAVAGGWTIVVKDLHLGPLYLGSLVHLENGEMYRAPFLLMLLGRSYAWWWRPTPLRALAKGHREARR